MDLQFSSFPYVSLLSSFLFALMLLKILKKRAKTFVLASKLPPGPWKLPIIGNLHQLHGSSLVHRTLRDLATKHGPLMYLKMGQVPTLVVSSPEFAKEVMKTHDATFASRPASLYSRIVLYDTKDIIYSPYGAYWRQMRKICTEELLSAARVLSFRPSREEAMSNLVEWIAAHEGVSINLSERIENLSYDVTARAAFGKESKDRDEFISVIEESQNLGFDPSDLFPFADFIPLIMNRFKSKVQRLHCKADRIMENIIKEHEKEKSEAKSCKTEDLIDVLLKFRNSEDLGFSLSTDDIKAVLFDIFSAGSEPSPAAVIWAMAEMIKNPRVMRKAQEEVREVFERKSSASEAGLGEMTYLKCVVKETLRLHPPAPLLIPRESREKCKISDYEIPAKTRVIINAWAIGRDPRYWSDPEKFIPERFIDSSVDFKGNNFEYTPFGAGRRICPGMSFGLINTEFPLAIMLYHFDWKLPNNEKPEDLDMTELFGVTITRRREHLHLIPSIFRAPTIENSLGK